MKKVCLVPLLVLVLVCGGCTVHQTEIPSLAGPSTDAVSFELTATPDNITQDGSQSTIRVRIRDVTGQPIGSVQLRLTIMVNASAVAFGNLSQTTLFTAADGTASAVYTAPTAGPLQAGTPGQTVTITATTVGSNYVNSTSRSALLRITPPAALPPVPGAPSVYLTSSPLAPEAGELIRFDASASQAQTGRQLVTFVWDFGDNSANEEHGSDASHAYAAPGAYTMVLAVIDDLGRVGTAIKTIVVSNEAATDDEP